MNIKNYTMSENKRTISGNSIGIKIFIGGVFLIFGLVTLEFYIGIIFLIVSLIAFTYSSGLEFDYDNGLIRTYDSYFGFKRGKWLNLNLFDKIMIRKSRKGVRYYGGRTNVSASIINNFYDVYLMSPKLKKSLLIYSSKDKRKSLEFAEKWSDELGIPLYE